MLICCAIIIPLLFALTFPILLLLVFAIPGLFLFLRWTSILGVDSDGSATNACDMKIPTFYSTSENINIVARIFVMSAVGMVFGGIHCVGWFFNFPSNDEAMLWRVCSAILTGIAFLLPLLYYLLDALVSLLNCFALPVNVTVISILVVFVYVVSRLILLVEAVISLRHLTPGMLALVKWTSFIPHI